MKSLKGNLSGYLGEDSMRQNAEKMFKLGGGAKGIKITQIETIGEAPERSYKRGGKVHPLSKMQTDMHLPHLTHESPDKIKFSRKSYNKERAIDTAKRGKGKHGWGGFIGSGLGALAGAGLGSLAGGVGAMPGALAGAGLGRQIGEALPFKKGGKTCAKKMAMGGVAKIRHKEATADGMPLEPRKKG